MMNIVTCLVMNNYYYHCLEKLNNIAKEDVKYKFELITNRNKNECPKLIIWTIATESDYAILSNVKDEFDIYQTVLIIEKLPSNNKQKELIEKLRENKKYYIYYNEPNNKEFYNEDFFKSIIDKLLNEEITRLMQFQYVRLTG